jgi:two-component system response regulator AtoC
MHTGARILAATNRDLTAEIRAGRFREDLYYRLNVIEVHIPALRERRDEIPALVDYFLARSNAAYGRAVAIAPAMRRLFAEYAWPGNIRQLENVIKRVVVLGDADAVYKELTSRESSPPAGSATEAMAVAPVMAQLDLKAIAKRAARDAERLAIADVLERTRWNRAKAARLLGISYKALLYKIVDCGLASRVEKTAAPHDLEAAASVA